jgi:hypothetical protein
MQNGFLQPSDFGDDDLSSVLGLSQNASQQQKLELQMRLANVLRQQQPAQGQSVPMGSTFIPPSPLTTAMQTFDHLQGIVASAQGKKQGQQLDSDRQKGLMHFAKMWFNKGGAQGGDPNDPNNPQMQGPQTSLMGSSGQASSYDENVPQQ